MNLTSPAEASLNILLLDQLRAAGGDYVPLEKLGPNLERVRGDLCSLVAFGFGIEQHPYRGAAYVGHAERLCPDQIEHGLKTRWLGRRIAVWSRVTSTNDLAARAGASSANDGLVILAEEQTKGRGRRGRSWCAPPRSSILMSVVLFPPVRLVSGDSSEALGRAWLTALGAIATAEVIATWTDRPAQIKWPNDVRVDGRKIAGILVERALAPYQPAPAPARPAGLLPAWGAVIGIGLNANLLRESFPPELAARATSIQIERGGAPVDRSELARDLVRELDHWYDVSRRGGPESLNAAWCQRSEHLGRVVRVATSSSCLIGRVVDLDVRLGVTLETGTLASFHGAEPAIPRQETEIRLAQIARLPLADIQTIEPFPPEQPRRGQDHDS